MKKLLFVLLALGIVQISFAQFKWGVKGGINTFKVKSDAIYIDDSGVESPFELDFDDSQFGYHLGLTGLYRGTFWFFQPNVILNTTRTTYRATEIFEGNESFFDETTYYLDVPLMFGFRFLGLRAGIGPVTHIFIANDTDFTDFDGYSEQFKHITSGYQVGLGLDLGHLHFDFNVERSTKEFGEHINLYGNEYQFDKKPFRAITSISYTF